MGQYQLVNVLQQRMSLTDLTILLNTSLKLRHRMKKLLLGLKQKRFLQRPRWIEFLLNRRLKRTLLCLKLKRSLQAPKLIMKLLGLRLIPIFQP